MPNFVDSFYRLGNENPSSARELCHAAEETEPSVFLKGNPRLVVSLNPAYSTKSIVAYCDDYIAGYVDVSSFLKPY